MAPCFILCFLLLLGQGKEPSPFEQAVVQAKEALDAGDLERAGRMVERALERDPNAVEAWELRASLAEAKGDRDDQVFSLHRVYQLYLSQKRPRAERRAVRQRLETLDPIAPDLLDLKEVFVKKLLPLADAYEKAGCPHSAIRVLKEILTLDPDRADIEARIQKIASRPDPSLAEFAKPRDLFAGVSEEWIKKFNEEHDTWKTRAKMDKENYTTYTDAGYEVLVRASEAMEQMNAFYRRFFRYGTPEDGHSVPKIALKIFQNRDEYLTLGSNPAKWSGGQYTGSAVETFVGSGGFDGMITTLFHEAAHQFIGLATTTVGWLNEGLASFFEGCRIQANGTVLMNMPANHRLFPLAARMEKGWMTSWDDGIDPKDPAASTPEKAPTFRIIIENRYQWGPPWYAPTWGVAYFLYNYQDPVDGRFVYRDAFWEFVNRSGGRAGEGAVDNFEEVVLAHPSKPTPGVDFSAAGEPLKLPRTVEELDEVWKEWILRLRDEVSGKVEVKRPYRQWAAYAMKRRDDDTAMEHFEKGLVEQPEDVEFLLEFAKFLAGRRKNKDRAARLALQAMRVLEFREPVDEKAVAGVRTYLVKWDDKWRRLERIHEELWAAARGLAQRYLEADLPLMAMEVSWRLGTELGVPDILPYFEEAVRRSGKTLWLWKLAYNEKNLDGWVSAGRDVFIPEGPELGVRYETYTPEDFRYQFLTLDTVTSGDFSMEAEIYAETGKVSFCGLVFGKKGTQNCQAAILFPGGVDPHRTGSVPRQGFLDLSTFYGPNAFKIWRHNALRGSFPDWHTLRIDVSGRIVDLWFDGDLVATHEFPSLEVLRGGFGLITGVGEARFRNVRYLARPANDPGARIEREIRMEKLREKTAPGGEKGPAGPRSMVGERPPALEGAVWIQGGPVTWDEKDPVPTLLVFFSIQQNELIPVDAWLNHMAEQYRKVGLRVVAVASAEDRKKLPEYLKEHPFPGAVCADVYRRKGYGEIFERYGIQYYNMPRVLLLDIDRTVYWEGDPGFRRGSPWAPGVESYLDAPLQELAEKRKLDTLVPWRKAWMARGRDALHEGNMAEAAPLLVEARTFGDAPVEEVREARRRLDLLEATLTSLEAAAYRFSREGCDPALSTLLQWGRLVGHTFDAALRKTVRPVERSPLAVAWKSALENTTRIRKGVKPGTEVERGRLLLDRIRGLKGEFPRRLREALSTAVDAGDGAAVLRVMDTAEMLPGRWLAQEYFNW